MELRQLRTLVMIADQGSFAGAAGVAGLTQSAVSLQVKMLEDELDCKLFDRTFRPPVLNARGEAAVARARTIVALCDELARTSGDAGQLQGTVTIGAVTSSLAGLVPEALAALRARHPGLHIKVISGLSDELAGAVRARELDAALLTEPERPVTGMDTHLVASEPLVVIAPPGTPGDSDEELLTALAFIQFNKRAWAGHKIQKNLKARAIKVKTGMEIDSLEAIARLVRQGLGVSIVPMPGGIPAFSSGLKWRAFGEPPLMRNLVVMERRAHGKAPLVSALVEVLRQVARPADIA